VKSRLLAGAAAVVLALVGAMLVITYAQGADQRAVKNLEPVEVLVVKTRFLPAPQLNPWPPPSLPRAGARIGCDGIIAQIAGLLQRQGCGSGPGSRRAVGC
jgi:hypothetical protein